MTNASGLILFFKKKVYYFSFASFFLFILLFYPIDVIHAAVLINEILPKTTDPSHQYVELYNTGAEPVSLDRWRIEIGSNSGKSFSMIASAIIQPQQFLAFGQQETGLTFSINGDSIKLIDDKGSIADQQNYAGILGYYTPVGRSTDGAGYWTVCTTQTKGKPNDCPAPTITPTPLPTAIPTQTPVPTPTNAPSATPMPSIPPPTQPLETQQVLAATDQNSSQTSTQASAPGADNNFLLIAAAVLIGVLWAGIIIIFVMKRKKR